VTFPPRLGLLLLIGAVASGSALAWVAQQRFDHWEHRELFPSCVGCHAGAAEAEASLWPAQANCADCHDGAIRKEVDWSPPPGPRASNLRFTHSDHAEELLKAAPDSALRCSACHTEPGADPMQVRAAVVKNCLDCHDISAGHLEAPDSTCVTCHVPLVQAVRLTRTQVSRFPTPASHRAPGFVEEGHGDQARTGDRGVAASCATCHARDYCTECHVDAPEVAAIQALESDPRSLAIRAELRAPASHADPSFLFRHGDPARKDAVRCATCHTQESCLDCHQASPTAALAMHAAGPGRGPGARVERKRPDSHGIDFSDNHAEPASARPQSCGACHARSQCLDCHRPNAADASPGYHPAGFLTTHPAAAYTRDQSCSDCHNQSQFCANCHVSSGLGSRDGLRGAGYHDAKAEFLLNHGQAARQNLESCVSCHSERDCLSCHSAQGGRRFNPHGPGFDPETLRRKNPSMCTACHGANIPGG
jgi:Doubled CXXCH motif (Paired_CXXCH_1)